MKLDKGGLISCGMYSAFFILLNGLGHFADNKGATLFAEFSVWPAEILLQLLMDCLGLQEPPFPQESWINSVYVFYLPSLLISYLLGWAISAIVRLLVGLVGGRLNRLEERLLNRLDEDV